MYGASHLYEQIMDLLRSYNFKIEFDKSFDDYIQERMRWGKNVLLLKSV